MLEPDRHPSISEVTCDDACAVLETVLEGPARGEMPVWALEGRSCGEEVEGRRSSMENYGRGRGWGSGGCPVVGVSM